jgi:HSP20 family molecular chaperone IbpA
MTTTATTTNEGTKEMAARQKHELTGAESTRPGLVFTPAVDIFETEDAITVFADMPGVKPDGVKVDLNENVLSLDGSVSPLEGDNEVVLVREFNVGSFHREFRLSNLVDRTKIDATMKDGVLRLTLPKAEAARPRKIEVRSA